MSDMDITIHDTFLPQDDPEAALAFYRDTLGFEVRNDVGFKGMHWITVGPAGQPDISIVLYPPNATPGVTEEEQRTISEMMAKGTFASLNLAAKNVDEVFERLQAKGPRSCRSRPISPTDCATARSATPRAICCGFNRPPEPFPTTEPAGGPGRPSEIGETMSKAPTPDRHVADTHDLIRVHGARVNNLKDISVEIPKRRLTVFTGVSGSGRVRWSSAPSPRNRSG
ncbi:Excinuclease ABC subunit A [Nocardia africana]|uniref:Excinuclease ABC subunit A n=1 Tax=Nocardia africana TaxID=134964 RepID=A0A378X625_9NOCA|nr:Excinuclease ABC subunit A [Nocardia africana]